MMGINTNRNRNAGLLGVIIVVVVIIILVSILATRNEKDQEITPWKSVYLRSYVRPEHYEIYYYPKFYQTNESTFEGNETIVISVDKSTKYILLHKLHINITSCRLIVPANIVQRKKEYEYKIAHNFTHFTHDYWVIETQNIIPAGTKLNLVLQFDGSLSHDLIGCYKGWFVDPVSNKTNYLVSTKFEPPGARYAFPCFDEPPFKATFTMHLIHKRTHFALFNSKELPSVPSNKGKDFVMTSFKKTSHPMSTYLVAWVVTENYDHYNTTITGNRLMRYYAPKYRIQDAKYALEVGSKLRLYMDNLFQFPSPLEKVDMITIPQFPSGAMENWGLFTYREPNLLYNELEGTESQKLRVCEVIAHELAHTWFGNIVTMKWWDDIWLNEAFASFFSITAVQNVTTWDVIGINLVLDRLNVMKQEDQISTIPVPIIQKVNQRTEMRANFNSYVYSKGGQLLYWLREVMGSNNFMKGIQSYIKKYQYETAITSNFLLLLDREAQGKLDVSSLMQPWLFQKGYPIIFVKYNNKTASITVSQFSNLASHFNISRRNDFKWNIPLTYCIRGIGSKLMPMMYKNSFNNEITFSISALANAKLDWILFNYNSLGYYRVGYDAYLTNLLVTQMRSSNSPISPIQRAIVIDDALQMAFAGYVPYNQTLQFISSIANEGEYPVWKLFERHITYIDALVANNTLIRKFMKTATNKIFANRNNVNISKGYLRNHKESSYLSIPCYFGNSACLEFTAQQFLGWLNGTAISPSVPTSSQYIVLSYGLQANDTEEMWSDALKKFEKNKSTNIDVMVKVLSATRNIARLRYLLSYIASNYTNNIDSLLSTVSLNDPWASKQVFAWLKSQCIDVLTNSFCKLITSKTVQGLTYYFKTTSERTDVLNFMSRYLKMEARVILMQIDANKFWSDQYSKEIQNFFVKNVF